MKSRVIPYGVRMVFLALRPNMSAIRHLLWYTFLFGAALHATGQSTWRADGLLRTWPVQQAMERTINRPQGGVISALDTRDLARTLRAGHPDLPVFADSAVTRLVEGYGQEHREHLRVMLGVFATYEPFLEAQVRAAGLPEEVKYLPLALSGINPLAASPSGGAGPWRLTRSVAVRYGLAVNNGIDERYDIRSSTFAAMNHARDLQQQYPTLELALIAFACGPANLTRARQRSGGATGMQALHPHMDLPEQDILPTWMAMMYLAEEASTLGIRPFIPGSAEPVDTVRTTRAWRLAGIEEALGIPAAQLRWLNPVICGTHVPAYHALLLPEGGRARFEAMTDSLISHEAAEREQVATLTTGSDEVQRLPDGREATYHRVRPGDQLGRIASRYGVGLSELKAWNQLKNDHIEVGELLTVYVTTGVRERTEGTAGEDDRDVATKQGTKDPTFAWYTVKRGDSLYSIAKRHSGVNADDLMRLNNIGPNIKAGQRIKIPK